MRAIALVSSPSPATSPPFATSPYPPPYQPRNISFLLSRRSVGGIAGEPTDLSTSTSTAHPARSFTRQGVSRASPGVDFLPSIYRPNVVVREARLEDCWEVAETHCSSFFPNCTFPLDLVLRVDRFVGLLSGFSVPAGCMRSCLVAVTGCGIEDNLVIGSKVFRVGGFEGKFSLNRGTVAGILTVDTVADFLPRRGPFRLRRTGIAYISNVAVRESERRKGIAKQLIAKAEACARSWGCRSIALHCDVTNVAATRLYKNQGYKRIKFLERANWPQPKTSPDMQFHFMMKLLSKQPLDST
ncbi:hypothetical protein Taro_054945 [Colocasia esculenta]|uniref:N-acetyltransferase domain-containing protein n=1 Tax=Colocasia esculenta TaxID=4460 RepID=A0A843XPS3_COLES|nr:hypothetical protein [Colocasia esculenta]